MASGGAPRHPRRGGFALTIAIVMVGLVAVVAVGLTSLMRGDIERTRRGSADAQLRQLLLAGAMVAQGADADGRRVVEAPLPGELSERGGTLTVTIEPAAGDGRVAEVVAALDGRRQAQRLTLRRAPTGWVVAEARVE